MLIRPALDKQSDVEGARLKVRDPNTMKLLAETGEEKPNSEYWRRRVRDGDVEIVEMTPTAKALPVAAAAVPVVKPAGSLP